MAKRGRKRKTGKREPNGRLLRAYDKGTERAQAMQAIYGSEGADAIGRAYKSGLLGDGQDAKAMLDTSRRISNAYWAAYADGSYTCTLGDRNWGSNSPVSPENARKREEWLNGCLDTANGLGRAHRRNFEQLCIDVNPDCGPDWLDRLCYAARTRAMMVEPADASCLERALETLAEIAGVEKPHVVRLKAA